MGGGTERETGGHGGSCALLAFTRVQRLLVWPSGFDGLFIREVSQQLQKGERCQAWGHGLCSRTASIRVHSQPRTSCVTVGKSVHIPRPRVPPLLQADSVGPGAWGCQECATWKNT